ncbi:MAG TPA: DUF423 domain-containing protein [Kofleriaceae bacterium]|nr:DUF423 domain-containing protein [Kofleriaceae bacterium]
MPLSHRPLVAMAALNGLAAVGAGAFAAHGLRSRLEPRALEIFETGARYQMYHALAMIACGALMVAWPSVSRGARNAGWLFQAGIAIFCGSLYALALTDVKMLGAITPIGGVLFLLGWLWLTISALRS